MQDFLTRFESRLRAGQQYLGSTDFLTLAAGGGNIKSSLQNPNASGKKLFVTRIEIAFDGSANCWCKLIWNPTAGIPTGAGTTTNLATGAAGVGLVKGEVGGTALSGGVIMQYFYATPSKYIYEARDGAFCIPANSYLALNSNFAAAAGAVNYAVSFFYFEE